jgi:hypothetical protein
MTALAFPILQVSGDSITGFRDEPAFRRALALTTDKAINAGFFRKARLIDAQLADHRVQLFELEGRTGLLGWMKRGRNIKALELTRSGELKLGKVLKAGLTS